MDLVSHLQADVRQVGQHLRQCRHDPLQRTQGARQDLGRLFTHIGNAQGVDEACKTWLLAGSNGRQQVLARQFGKAFQVDNLLEGQLIEVGRRTDQAFIHQLLDALFAEPFDVHGTPRDVVNDRLLELRSAGQTADTAVHRALTDGFLALAALDQLRALYL
ncbi:hypothetical protein D3C81_1487390 [compost metagenome]